jgi:hypothetical protein
MVRTLFTMIEGSGDNMLFEMEASFVEIYLEKVNDLLD